MAKGTALITGASSGIGAELARLAAGGGYDLVLVARNRAELEALGTELSGAHGIAVRVVAADLSNSAAADAIFDATRDLTVEILINNAGFGLRGAYAETDWNAEARMMQVNMTSPARLTKLYLQGMIERRSGRILNVVSTAAFVPGPFMAMYYASKAFLLSLSESIANEVQGTGVTVTALCPGPTRTHFDSAAGISDSKLFDGPVMTAAEVARIGFDAMMAGKVQVIAGARNLWMIRGARLAPRTMLANITRRLNSGVK
jgi:short-subunit dehydrogenase